MLRKRIGKKVDHFFDRLNLSTYRNAVGRYVIVRYLLAIVLILLALLLRFSLAPQEAGLPFITFFPAVTLIGLWAGFGPGLFAIIICCLLANYLFFQPFNSFLINYSPSILSLDLLFSLEELIVLVVIKAMYRNYDNYVANEEQLKQLQINKIDQKIAAIVFDSQEAIIVTDAKGIILKVNSAFKDLTGYSAEEAIGQSLRILKSGENDADFYKLLLENIKGVGDWTGEVWDRDKTGKLHPKWMTISTIKDDDNKITHYIVRQTDLSGRKFAEQKIEQLAFYDVLTGLANRNWFHDRFQLELDVSKNKERSLALLLINLDRFKVINDTYGHDVGDRLLEEVAKRLLKVVRESDTVARLGGDEFAIILSELKTIQAVKIIVMTVLESLALPFYLGSHQCHITASIGIAIYPKNATEAMMLLKNADQAMTLAKSMGRNTFAFFSVDMQETMSNRLSLDNDLRQALPRREFALHYQPVVDLDTGQVRKAEAVIHWHHWERGIVNAAEFIPFSEANGLITDISHWVFQQAVTDVKRWRDSGFPDFSVSINLSSVQLRSPCADEIYKQWLELLEHFNLPGGCITLKIKEDFMMGSDENAIKNLLFLQAAGLRMAIDHFGTGYSVFSYLKKFKIDYLKIDPSFVVNLSEGSVDRDLCEAMIVMAHKLGIKVIAEGIKTQAQRDLLLQVGCDFGQGDYFSHSVPVSEFTNGLAVN